MVGKVIERVIIEYVILQWILSYIIISDITYGQGLSSPCLWHKIKEFHENTSYKF